MFCNSEKMMSHRCLFLFVIFSIFFIYSSLKTVKASSEDNTISKWSEKLGEELWELGKRMTKAPEIRAKYKEYNARVERKDGEQLIKSIVESIGLMLSRKMEAIQHILEKAEEAAETEEFNETEALNEFQYYSSKYSAYDGRRGIEDILPSVEENLYMYKNMTLNQDTHFYNISVNTSYSSVHVPSNIWDRNLDVLRAIMWSEKLDKVFEENYEADPALSWQYFGSDTGILRHYPALQWEVHERADTYDCRKRSWYIETATCSKDIVILLDSSGSMYGFRYHIAKFTIRSIMDTFSNNDFFTILKYSKGVYDVVDCFHDILVQATPENIKIFNDALAENSTVEGYADVNKAYEAAFQLLRKYSIQRRCNESSTGCNQAIMLVTDGVSGNTTEIFEKYNWDTGDNSTKSRVRVFTYLLGKEVTKVREIQWMACLNRGYYSHVQTLDEVHEEVLKYVDVIATPLVLQDKMHPPTWTHAFTDKAYEQEEDDTPPRLMIAVGVPAFDRSYKEETNSTRRRARLLGVAGTDVPVEDIDKLALPYKLGVNGYAFVISNNGYVILHPDLRPVVTPKTFSNDPTEKHKGVLNINYNSIDLTEVEQMQSQTRPREPEDTLIELRRSMVMHESGKITDVAIKFHYDKMRRVSPEYQDYFYAPLPNTPFSLGLVLPSKYGKTWIKVGDEVKRNQHLNVNISNYFVGQNWKIHPDWVYCKYHYLEGHEFKTPELELLHFLNKLYDPKWKWSVQYENKIKPDDCDIHFNKNNCGDYLLGEDDYYCNKELVQLLIFDAKVTNTSYGMWKFTDDYERELIKNYNATLRFVATMSGLTRWQFIFGEVEKPEDKEFGDYHTTAIDETWYKSAILQHSIDPDSFVYSVSHVTDPPEEGELQVTASHAIFPRDGGLEAPGCVVGFQFSHQSLYERFVNITSEDHCNGCMETCGSDIIHCYLVDNNGYVIVSSADPTLAGRYLGELEGDIMEKLIEDEVFTVIPVYDTQSVCRKLDLSSNDGTKLSWGVEIFAFAINWIVTEIMWYLGRINLWVQGIPFYEDLEPDFHEHYDIHDYDDIPHFDELPKTEEIKPTFVDEACDTQSNLVILQQNLFMKGNTLNMEIITNCKRPFHIKRIPKSNLILIVVNTLYRRCDDILVLASPQKIEYPNLKWPCHKINLSFYERRRLEECFTEHPNESEFTYCGDATSIQLKFVTFIMSTIFLTGFHIISN